MRVVGLTFEKKPAAKKKAAAKGKNPAAKDAERPEKAAEQAQEPEKAEEAEGDGD
jgi:hypothetical protein